MIVQKVVTENQPVAAHLLSHKSTEGYHALKISLGKMTHFHQENILLMTNLTTVSLFLIIFSFSLNFCATGINVYFPPRLSSKFKVFIS